MYEEIRFNEGFEWGFASGGEMILKRLEEAYDNFGIDVSSVRCLPCTPEVMEFIETGRLAIQSSKFRG
jgi:hypothetical protein